LYFRNLIKKCEILFEIKQSIGTFVPTFRLLFVYIYESMKSIGVVNQ